MLEVENSVSNVQLQEEELLSLSSVTFFDDMRDKFLRVIVHIHDYRGSYLSKLILTL